MEGNSLRQWSLFFTWIIALISVLATLYAGHILDMPVCHLCWYQRICIYPLVIIIGMASFRNDASVAIYTIPLTLLGAVFAFYQYLEQMIPGFAPIDVCSGGPSCSETHIQLLGFITFPFLSLLACLVMFILLVIAYRHRN